MIRISRTARFRADIRHCIFFLAQRNPLAADRYLSLIDEKIQHLASNPRMAESRPYLGDGVRKLSIPPYQLFYRVDEDRVMLLRLLHSSQHICKAMLTGNINIKLP